MEVPKLDIRYLVKSAVVVVLVIALWQYFGGLLVESSGGIDLIGLATIGVMFLIGSALIGIISVNTSLPTPDWAMRNDQ